MNGYGMPQDKAMENDAQLLKLAVRVDHLETDVGDIKVGVQKLLDRPSSPVWGQLISTILTTLATIAIIFGFAEWRLMQAVQPVDVKLTAFESRQAELSNDNQVKLAVLEERTNWLRSLQGWAVATRQAPTP